LRVIILPARVTDAASQWSPHSQTVFVGP